MKKLLTLLLATCFVLPVMAKNPKQFDDNSGGVPFVTKATLDDNVVYAGGTLYGLDFGPSNGEYEIIITNAYKYKKATFDYLKCVVMKKAGRAEKMAGAAVVETTYYEKDGSENTAIGYVTDMEAYPENGYVVDVKNGRNVSSWNVLRCQVK